MFSGWIIGVLGIWTFIIPFIGATSMGYAWTDWIVGIIAAVLGFSMMRHGPAEGWITGILGVWLFIAGFIPALVRTPGVWWNDLIAGALLVIFGLFGGRAMEGTMMHGDPHPSST